MAVKISDTCSEIIPLELNIDLELIEGSIEPYKPMNFQILKLDEDLYLILVRCINYATENSKEFNIFSPDGHFRSINYIGLTGKDMKFKNSPILINDMNRERIPVSCHGFEDCRLFEYNDNIMFSCTLWDLLSYKNGIIAEVNLGPKTKVIDYINKGGNLTVEYIKYLPSPHYHIIEKNWLPFIYDDEIVYIYSYNPYILICNNHIIVNIKTPNIMSNFRGSARPIDFEMNDIQGYILLVHEAEDSDNGRKYYHRLVWTENLLNLKNIKISKKFYFEAEGVEFCSSISYDDNILYMATSIKDKNPKVFTIDTRDLVKIF